MAGGLLAKMAGSQPATEAKGKEQSLPFVSCPIVSAACF